MSGFWDDPSVAPSGGAFMKFVEVGDRVEGTISRLGKRTFDSGRDAFEITFAEDDAPTATAGQVLLKEALLELKPVVGERLSIELVALDVRGEKTWKRFRVEVTRADGETQVVDQSQ